MGWRLSYQLIFPHLFITWFLIRNNHFFEQNHDILSNIVDFQFKNFLVYKKLKISLSMSWFCKKNVCCILRHTSSHYHWDIQRNIIISIENRKDMRKANKAKKKLLKYAQVSDTNPILPWLFSQMFYFSLWKIVFLLFIPSFLLNLPSLTLSLPRLYVCFHAYAFVLLLLLLLSINRASFFFLLTHTPCASC